MTPASTIPGVAELTGNGVYCGMPVSVPRPIRDAHAVVAGRRRDCAAAARRLRHAGWKVTVVTTDRANLVWATGVEYLEAVVLQHICSGRIDACNASALFIL